MSGKKYEIERLIDKLIRDVKTIAVVGFSSKKHKAGYYVPKYLQKHGYRIIPVNPMLEEGLGEKAYPDLASIPVPVDLVLIFRRSESVPPFAQQAIDIGAPAVWMQQGIINDEAAAVARQAGLDVVMDRCMKVEHKRRIL